MYQRFAKCGRMAPAGLRYVVSWVTKDLTRLMRVLHEEVIGRFALLDEAGAARNARQRRGTRR